MRTINFTEQDIKDCKLALANQNLTSLQSAFLGQYINNLEGQLQQKDNIIKEAREYLINTNYDSDLPKLMEILDKDKQND